MKPHPLLITALLALTMAGCSRTSANSPDAAGATNPAPAAPQANARIELDAAAQNTAGIRVEQATERSLPEVIRASARLTNDENRTWRVGALTEGRVLQVLAGPGDLVKEGQPLARIHSHDVHDARAEFRKAGTELARAKATVDFATKARDRARRLYELKAGSLEQVERAESELHNAEAVYNTARTEVDHIRSHLEEFLGIPAEDDDAPSKEGVIDERDLIPVRSPAAGIVLTRNITPGAVVTSATDLFVISDLSSLWAIAEVSEEQLSKMRPGMPVRISVPAWANQTFSGRVGRLGESLDPATRTVKVRIDIPNGGGHLKPEMYATAEIDVGGSHSAVFVGEEAVQEVHGQNVVFVKTAAGQFEVRPVETGRTLEGSLEIRRGLRNGESVVARGAFIVKSEYLKSAL